MAGPPQPRDPRGPRGPSDGVRGALAASSLAAAGVHLGVVGEHLREAAILGVFFVAIAALQTAWSVAMLTRPSRRLEAAGAMGSGGLILLWIASRTVGLPVGVDHWTPEAVGSADLLATVCEAAVVAGVAWLLAMGWRPGSASRRVVSGSAMRAAWVLAPLTAAALIAGGHGARPFGAVPAHHAHLIVLSAACAVYSLYLALHGWVNGGYRFTWRLRPEGSPPSTPWPEPSRALPARAGHHVPV
jgi:hypothetical protein